MENKHKQFNAYDKVLVRDDKYGWLIDFYSHRDEDGNYIVMSFGPELPFLEKQILPYEGNEHLVGTTDEPEEEIELEEGELIVVSDFSEDFTVKMNAYGLQTFHHLNIDCFECYNGRIWKYAVRLSDFNPNDMQESRKHILYVKNGKVVRFKEGMI